MATRNEIQIAQDIIKFTNIMNDLLDCLSWQLQEIDPNTGGVLTVTPEGESARPYTVLELREIAIRTISNVFGYRNQMANFLTKIDISMVTNGLMALGVDRATIQQEIESMRGVCNYLNTAVPGAADKTRLAEIGVYISANVPKLKLVRRAWAL